VLHLPHAAERRDAGVRMDRIKRWIGNLFWSVAGNAVWTCATGGVFFAGATVVLSHLRAFPPVWLDRGITALIVLAVVMIGSGIETIFRRRRRSADFTAIRPLSAESAPKPPQVEYKEIVNQSFQSQDVLLDGHIFINCTFTDVTFVYNNGETGGFDSTCKVGGHYGFKSRDPHIQQMLYFLVHLRFMRPSVNGRYTPILGDLPNPAADSIVVKTPTELISHWSRLVAARDDAGERFEDLENTYEYFMHFWEDLINQNNHTRQVWFDKNFPGQSLTPERVDDFRQRTMNAAFAARDALMIVLKLLAFQVPKLGV
jgi:hypothetical protein